MGRDWLCLSILEAFPDLILSSSMCNECEFSHLGSDEGLCLSPVSVGVWPVWWLLVFLPRLRRCRVSRDRENRAMGILRFTVMNVPG